MRFLARSQLRIANVKESNGFTDNLKQEVLERTNRQLSFRCNLSI
jgi:hypothetical protein